MLDEIRKAVHPLQLIQQVAEQAITLVPAAGGAAIGVVDADGDVSFVCTAGFLAGHIGHKFGVDNTFIGLALRTGRTLCSVDIETDARVDRRLMQDLGIRSLVCLPLCRRDESVGVLQVAATTPGAFDEADVFTLNRLAEFCSLVIGAAADFDRVSTALLEDGSVGRARARQHDTLDAEQRFVADVLQPGLADHLEARRRIERALEPDALSIVYQPIFDMSTGEMVAAEALTRFGLEPHRTPDVWFAEAHEVGLGHELELASIRAALVGLPDLPDSARLAFNCGPSVLLSRELLEIVAGIEGGRVIIELTEHVEVADYADLARALGELRSGGALLAIDDTGAGVASLAHILKLAPDLIKLDRVLTSGIDRDPVRRALAYALGCFAAETGSRVIAEGIETSSEVSVLCRLGIQLGQGFHLARPAPLADMANWSSPGPRPAALAG